MSTTLNDEQKKTYASATKLELMSSEVSENSSDNEPPSEGATTAGRSQLLIRPLPWRAIETTKVFEFLDRKYARRQTQRGTVPRVNESSSIYQNTSGNDIVPEWALEDFC